MDEAADTIGGGENWAGTQYGTYDEAGIRPFRLPHSETPGISEFGGLQSLSGQEQSIVRGALNQAAAAGGAENAIGFGADGSLMIDRAWLTDSAKWTGKAAGYGIALAAANVILDKIAPGTSGWLNLGLGVFDLVSSGNPFGLAANAALAVWRGFSEAEERRKTGLEDAQRYRGRKLGYIREGDEWYPAMIDVDAPGTGFGDNSNVMTMNWGKNVVWRQVREKGSMRWEPFFLNGSGNVPTGHELHRTITDVTDDMIEKNNPYMFYQKNDPMRNWYLLDDEQLKTLTPETFVQHADDTFDDANPYAMQMNDWRKVLEMQSLDPFMPADLQAQKYTTDPSAMLRDLANTGHEAETYYSMLGDRGYTDAGFGDMDASAYYSKMRADNDFSRASQPENDWLLNTMFMDQVQILMQEQRAAADEQGFKELYGHDDYLDYNPDYKYEGAHRGQPIWASLYLDTANSMPMALDYTDLQSQLGYIDGITDRTPAQIQYLHQKSVVRYWMNQIGQRGGTEQMVKTMYDAQAFLDRKRAFTGKDPERAKMMLNGASFDFDRITKTKHDGWDALDDPYENDQMYGSSKKMQEISGWIMPWQNEGEGIVPGGMMNSGMSDWYRTEIERVNQDATANVNTWVTQHGYGVNPNSLLEGGNAQLDDVGITDRLPPKTKPDDDKPEGEPVDVVAQGIDAGDDSWQVNWGDDGPMGIDIPEWVPPDDDDDDPPVPVHVAHESEVPDLQPSAVPKPLQHEQTGNVVPITAPGSGTLPGHKITSAHELIASQQHATPYLQEHAMEHFVNVTNRGLPGASTGHFQPIHQDVKVV